MALFPQSRGDFVTIVTINGQPGSIANWAPRTVGGCLAIELRIRLGIARLDGKR